MGRDRHPCRPAVPTPATERREEVLALRGERGGAPPIFGGEPPRPRLEAVRSVDMSDSNVVGGVLGHLPPDPPGLPRARGRKDGTEEARAGGRKEATGPAERSKSGAISFELVDEEPADAPLQ